MRSNDQLGGKDSSCWKNYWRAFPPDELLRCPRHCLTDWQPIYRGSKWRCPSVRSDGRWALLQSTKSRDIYGTTDIHGYNSLLHLSMSASQTRVSVPRYLSRITWMLVLVCVLLVLLFISLPILGLSRVRGRPRSPSDLAEASIISGLGPLCLHREGAIEKTVICDYLTICEDKVLCTLVLECIRAKEINSRVMLESL